MADKPHRPTGWLASIQGKIAALAGILVALGTLVGAGMKLWESVNPGKDAPKVPVAAEAVQAKDCLEVEPLVWLREIPYALIHNWRTSETLDWLKLEIKNRCDRSFILEVICEEERADVGVECEASREITVKPEREEYSIDPALEFMGDFDRAVTLGLKVIVQDVPRQDSLFVASREVTVHPPNTYFWELENTSKEAVLASLAVWTVAPRAAVGELAERLATGYSSVEDWMRRAYQAVLVEEGLVVRRDDRQIPPKRGRESLWIKTPEEVLADGEGHPVETALLFGALGHRIIRQRSARIVLISAPPKDPEQPNEVFVAWESGGRLRAFEVPITISATNEPVPAPDFEEAVSRADRELERLLRTIQRALDRKESTGVFIGQEIDRLVALDLGQTLDAHRLEAGLPSWTRATPPRGAAPSRPIL